MSAITVPARRGGARPGRRPALAALVVGLAYAGVSVYWGAGGTWLLDTVGRSLTAGGAVAAVAVWAAAGLKVVAAVLPVLAVGRLAWPPPPARPAPPARAAAVPLPGPGRAAACCGSWPGRKL